MSFAATADPRPKCHDCDAAIVRPFGGRASRGRARYVALALATIAIGLLVHLEGTALGAVARDILGDALWAAMMVWWVSALAPGARRSVRSAAAYGVCVAVEVSQLYHTPTIDAIRATRLGHLVLGSGFDPRDFVAYGLGLLGAWLLDAVLAGRHQSADVK